VRFVDTSFWVALQFARDGHHGEARALWADRTTDLITTNHVVGETWTFLRRRIGHRAARDFVDGVTGSPRIDVRRLDEATEKDAWNWLRRHDEREYSFVDATSFALMRRLAIGEALAFDGGFAAAGFVEVRA
jgi:predicted nucleic acid-binding protein